MTRRRLIAGNWKMNTSRAEAVGLASAVARGGHNDVDVVLCPPFPWLIPVAEAIAGSGVGLGAQNCWTEPKGAVTGEVSPAMLAELCQYVIVGHSERRRILGESDELVAQKLRAALASGLKPILCVGEDQSQRQQGQAVQVVRGQLTAALAGLSADDVTQCVVAYEPIWAIGTGTPATGDDAAEMATVIRNGIADDWPEIAPTLRILYGGSVTAGNAAELLSARNVDGALVGGASLKADAFLGIIAAD